MSSILSLKQQVCCVIGKLESVCLVTIIYFICYNNKKTNQFEQSFCIDS